MAATIILVGSHSALGASASWVGGGGEANRSWSHAANWSAAPPNGTDVATFNGTAPVSPILVDANRSIYRMIFTAGGYMIGETTGPTLTLVNNGANKAYISSSTGRTTLNAPLQMAGGTQLVTSSATEGDWLKVGGNISSSATSGVVTLELLGGGTSLPVPAGAYGEVSGIISDGATGAQVEVYKHQLSTWTLSGANEHSGGTRLATGTLNLNNARALGSGTFTLAGSSSLDNTSGGAIKLTGYAGFSFAGNQTLTFLGSNDLNLGTASITVGASGTRTFQVEAGVLTTEGNLSGGANVAKRGAGTVVFAGNHSAYTGTLTIFEGVARFGSSSAFSNTQRISLSGSGIVALTAASGNLVAALGTSAGTFTINGGGFSAFDADVSLSFGTNVRWGQTGWADASNAFILSSSEAAATLDFVSNLDLNNSASAQRTRNVIVNNGSADIDAKISGAVSGSAVTTFEKTGAGTLLLGAANPFTGDVKVTEGRLILGENATLNSVIKISVSSGAVFEYRNTSVGLSKQVDLVDGSTFIYNSSGAYTGGVLSVGTGSKLGGAGLVGAVILNEGGVIAPGNSIGTLSLNDQNFTWNGESALGHGQMQFELSNVDNASDHFNLGLGVFQKGGGSYFTFDFLDTGRSGGAYSLLSFGSFAGFSISDFTYVNLADGLTGEFVLTANNLQFVIVPEPGSLQILALGLGAGLIGWKRSRRGVARRI